MPLKTAAPKIEAPKRDERILVAGPNDDDAFRIRDANPWLDEAQIEWAGDSNGAIDRLSDSRHPFTLLLVDRELGPDPATSLISFVRRAPASPYPGLAVGLIGTGIQPIDVRRAIHAGCLMSLSRPFASESLSVAVRTWAHDRSDFLVSGAYVGPDRRRVAGFADADRRHRLLAREQSIASTALLYDIAAETTAFRFKRLPADIGLGSPALSLRNGLRRATVAPAIAHIALKKKEGLGMLGRQAGAMGMTWKQLQATLAPPVLARLNGQALESADLSSQRGLTLLAAITGSLARYSGGRHRLGPRLVAFLRAHLDGAAAALRHRIDDDGGPVGRKIMASLKDAERRFAEPAAGYPEGAAAAARA